MFCKSYPSIIIMMSTISMFQKLSPETPERLLRNALKANTTNDIQHIITTRGTTFINQTVETEYPINLALLHGNIDTVRLLLLNGANPNQSDSILRAHYPTPLFLCALLQQYDSIERLQLLLLHDADTSITNCRGQTILHSAIWCTTPSYVLALTHININLDSQDDNGQTPLHYIAGYNPPIVQHNPYHHIIKSLIAHGADINIQDKQGQTPLHLAIKIRRYNLANYLITQGANTNILNNDGLRPIEMISKKHHHRIHL